MLDSDMVSFDFKSHSRDAVDMFDKGANTQHVVHVR